MIGVDRSSLDAPVKRQRANQTMQDSPMLKSKSQEDVFSNLRIRSLSEARKRKKLLKLNSMQLASNSNEQLITKIESILGRSIKDDSDDSRSLGSSISRGE